MNTEGIIVIGTAGIAVVSAFVAALQAHSAKDSAASARRQAEAAEEQVQLMRRQMEADTAALDEAAGPSFVVENPRHTFDGERFVTAMLVMAGGSPLASITARVRGDDVRGLVSSVGGRDRLKELVTRDISPGGRFELIAEVEYRAGMPVNVTVDLECFEEGGKQRSWNRSYTVAASEPPPDRKAFGTWR